MKSGGLQAPQCPPNTIVTALPHTDLRRSEFSSCFKLSAAVCSNFSYFTLSMYSPKHKSGILTKECIWQTGLQLHTLSQDSETETAETLSLEKLVAPPVASLQRRRLPRAPLSAVAFRKLDSTSFYPLIVNSACIFSSRAQAHAFLTQISQFLHYFQFQLCFFFFFFLDLACVEMDKELSRSRQRLSSRFWGKSMYISFQRSELKVLNTKKKCFAGKSSLLCRAIHLFMCWWKLEPNSEQQSSSSIGLRLIYPPPLKCNIKKVIFNLTQKKLIWTDLHVLNW